MRSGITVMKSGTLKLVKMHAANAAIPMLSIPSWRRIGVRREREKASLQILLSELGMLILVIERSQYLKDCSPISTRPSHSSTSELLALGKCISGDHVTEGRTRARTTSRNPETSPHPTLFPALRFNTRDEP